MILKLVSNILSNDMDNIYENIDEYNLNKKWKLLRPFDHIIDDMLNHKKYKQLVTEVSIRKRKLIISLILITQSYSAVPKNVRLYWAHLFTMKMSRIWEPHKTTISYFSDIGFK